MSGFGGMEDLLQDFLTESSELLSEVDNKLVELEKRPDDKALLNDIFRGFHTIKGGAGFLNVDSMVSLCHRTENLFDKLRNAELTLDPEIMDEILAATGVVREMFGEMSQGRQPSPADPALLKALDDVLEGRKAEAATTTSAPEQTVPAESATKTETTEPDWPNLYNALLGENAAPTQAKVQAAKVVEEKEIVQIEETSTPTTFLEPMQSLKPAPAAANNVRAQANTQQLATQETTIRIDTVRLDQVLNLSGEIGLTKNRLTTLRADIMSGKMDGVTLKALDEAIGQLDLLVGDLQNAVMKTRMQPIGRLFQKYPRLARDLARQMGKDVELVISGEETELDKTMLEDLNDPLVHLVRNAVDHGVETTDERVASGKPAKAVVELTATQVGDHIRIEIIDDGRGMRPDVIRRKAIEKGLIDIETANSLDDKQSLQLIFLPGFSTKDQISSVSGRGVGMDVVKTNIQKLNGRVDIQSTVGEGSRFTISLPLTLAILPVLVVKVCDQPFAVPLAMVREIITIRQEQVQEVSGRATIVVRDEILSVRSLAHLIGWNEVQLPQFGVLMQSAEHSFILAVDSFIGRDDVVIKPLQNIRPKGVAGATLSGDGSIVLVLDMEDLLASDTADSAAIKTSRFIEQLN
ncbi:MULTISPECIES: chemotaxis protein CheA [Deefgea]|uniref:histidine kinase n=1 Tax=Deefgea chitinilytica TaxID=570276 RepID=A0ABS2CFP1_9NEIS|nr:MULTISPECIES: chemotaxis protein CheA [Deefgea]MBM5572964.1 chemotaxis protein CheA [Deefgea chitinilytica]MBM9890200.1 chemotaxis protein CheA [Deefgea sp. CFH1-16]